MSQAQQDVLAIERALLTLRQDYEKKGRRFSDLLAKNTADVTMRRALQGFHDAALAWHNERGRLLVAASLSGATQNDTWYTHHAETALDLMTTIPLHYATVFAVAERLGIPAETFNPSSTAFSELQRLVVDTYPEFVAMARQAFADLGLPTVGFDVRESCKSRSSKADLLLVTVNEIETQALLRAVEQVNRTTATTVPLGDRFYRDLGAINGTKIFHALSQMGSGGLGAAQQTVEKAIREIRPKAVIAVGIAFGVNTKKQAIGDILISKQLWLYELQRVGKEEIKPRGDKVPASPRLINFFEGVSQISWSNATVRLGLVLTGEKLVDDVDYRDQLLAFESEAIGGEMEGAGVYVSSHDHKTEWIVIKAICDWADGNKRRKKEERQKLAASNACGFLVHALQQGSLKAIL